MKEILDRLRTIAGNAASNLTADDKQFIKEQSEQAGLTFEPKGACKNCYIDQAVLLYKHLSKTQPAEQSDRAYVLKEGVDIIWQGIRINAATATDDLCKRWLAMGLGTKYFAKYGTETD